MRTTQDAAATGDDDFAPGDLVMHPAHGVGRVEGFSQEVIAGQELDLVRFVFGEGRLTVRVPRAKIRANGLRRLAGRELIDRALATLRERPKAPQRGITWARRSQELQQKLNSGDPRLVAEVLRDLGRNAANPERSFSERQLFEAALDRLAVEIAAVEGIDREAAIARIMAVLPTGTGPNESPKAAA